MARPITPQASASVSGPWAALSSSKASVKRPLEASSMRRPPMRSMRRPAQGLTSAERMSAIDKAAKTCDGATPRSRAIGAASMAGR